MKDTKIRNIMEVKLENSFWKGYRNFAGKSNQKKVQEDIMKGLGVTRSASFSNRLKGRVNHSPAERTHIERVFKKYGVTEVWGD